MAQVKIKYLANRPITVLIESKDLKQNVPKCSNNTDLCYVIRTGESISYSRSDCWNCIYFELESGQEFKIRNPKPFEWLSKNSFEEVALLA